MSASQVRIAIVDDHPIFRDGLLRSLQDEADFEVVGAGSTAHDAITLFKRYRPDAVLLDLSMPGGGHAALRSILKLEASASVIVLTASEDEDDLSEALKGGAKGYVLKGVDASTLIDVVRGVVAGEHYVSPALERHAPTRGEQKRILEQTFPHAGIDPLAMLSPREAQILFLVADGDSNKEIGRRLNLTEKTVKHNMTRILRKLNARNRTEAAMLLRDASAGH